MKPSSSDFGAPMRVIDVAYGSGSLAFEFLSDLGFIPAGGGLYEFLKPDDDGQWRPVFIGETDDFGARLTQHDLWADAQRLGATEIAICAYGSSDDTARKRAAQHLIARWNPAMNQPPRGGVSRAAQATAAPRQRRFPFSISLRSR